MNTMTWVVITVVAIVLIALLIIASRRSRGERLRQLPEPERARYAESWRVIEAQFVEDPRAAVAEADRLVVDIYRQRGGRSETMPERVREARGLNSPGQGDSTEALRRSMQSYRAAVGDLLGMDPRAGRGRKEVVA